MDETQSWLQRLPFFFETGSTTGTLIDSNREFKKRQLSASKDKIARKTDIKCGFFITGSC
jgi:hypothetical protein